MWVVEVDGETCTLVHISSIIYSCSTTTRRCTGQWQWHAMNEDPLTHEIDKTDTSWNSFFCRSAWTVSMGLISIQVVVRMSCIRLYSTVEDKAWQFKRASNSDIAIFCHSKDVSRNHLQLRVPAFYCQQSSVTWLIQPYVRPQKQKKMMRSLEILLPPAEL